MRQPRHTRGWRCGVGHIRTARIRSVFTAVSTSIVGAMRFRICLTARATRRSSSAIPDVHAATVVRPPAGSADELDLRADVGGDLVADLLGVVCGSHDAGWCSAGADGREGLSPLDGGRAVIHPEAGAGAVEAPRAGAAAVAGQLAARCDHDRVLPGRRDKLCCNELRRSQHGHHASLFRISQEFRARAFRDSQRLGRVGS